MPVQDSRAFSRFLGELNGHILIVMSNTRISNSSSLHTGCFCVIFGYGCWCCQALLFPYISLIANDVEHLFLCLFAVDIFSFMKCLMSFVVLYEITFLLSEAGDTDGDFVGMMRFKCNIQNILATHYTVDLLFVYTHDHMPDWEQWLTAASQYHEEVF